MKTLILTRQPVDEILLAEHWKNWKREKI